MKKLFTLISAVLFAGSMMAESVTVALVDGVFSDEQITWTEVNGNIVVSQMKGNSGTAVNAGYIALPRVYKGHILKFEGLNNYAIDSVKIKFSGSYYGNSMTAGVAVASNVVTDAPDSVARTFAYTSGGTHVLKSAKTVGLSKIYLQNVASVSNTQLRPTEITVFYTKPVVTTPTIEGTGHNFKTIPTTATEVEDTLAIEGMNLTEAITYSLVNNNVFTVSGTLTAAGGDLTVSVNPSVAGVYTDTIVLSSTGATKKLPLDVKVVATTGDGSQENPFTLADVFAMNNEYAVEAWVIGEVYGVYKNSKPTNVIGTENTNIALVSGLDTIPVQLVAGDVRDAINLKDHSELVGHTLKVKGSLESYMSQPGVKGTSDYAVDTPTAIENNENNVKVVKVLRNGMILLETDHTTYNVQGQTVR